MTLWRPSDCSVSALNGAEWDQIDPPYFTVLQRVSGLVARDELVAAKERVAYVGELGPACNGDGQVDVGGFLLNRNAMRVMQENVTREGADEQWI